MTNQVLFSRITDLIDRTSDPRDLALLAKLAEWFLVLAAFAELTLADDDRRAT